MGKQKNKSKLKKVGGLNDTRRGVIGGKPNTFTYPEIVEDKKTGLGSESYDVY